MSKVKIKKKLPKGKRVKFETDANKRLSNATDKFTENYLQFYDDIKVPFKRYDW